MHRLLSSAIGTLLAVATVHAQDIEMWPTLQEAFEDLSYAELLSAGQLKKPQLERLVELQNRWLDETALTGEIEALLQVLRLSVHGGKTVEEALRSLGPLHRQVQESRAAMDRTRSISTAELRGVLTKEQQDAFLLFASPLRQLRQIAENILKARRVPKPQWEQVSRDMTRVLTGFARRTGTGQATPERIGEMLAAVREMPDDDVQVKGAGLAEEWAAVLAPNVVQMTQSREWRDRQLSSICQRLVCYPRGRQLVQEKLGLLK